MWKSFLITEVDDNRGKTGVNYKIKNVYVNSKYNRGDKKLLFESLHIMLFFSTYIVEILYITGVTGVTGVIMGVIIDKYEIYSHI